MFLDSFTIACVGAWATMLGLAVALCLSVDREARKAQRRAPRLGTSIWLCTACHTLYREPVVYCGAGHLTQRIVEATAWVATHPPQKTEPLGKC